MRLLASPKRGLRWGSPGPACRQRGTSRVGRVTWVLSRVGDGSMLPLRASARPVMDEEVVDTMPPSTPSPATSTDLLSPKQAAQVIGVSHDTIRGWIAGGALPVVRIGSRRCIAPADL